MERDVTIILNKKREDKVRSNLTKEQFDELRNLREDKSLVIQSADKGGAIVILDWDAYDQESKRQLPNTTFYKTLDCNPISVARKQTHSRLDTLLEQGEITKSEHTFVMVESLITPVFSTLPKHLQTHPQADLLLQQLGH